jgi:hypothetical protein
MCDAKCNGSTRHSCSSTCLYWLSSRRWKTRREVLRCLPGGPWPHNPTLPSASFPLDLVFLKRISTSQFLRIVLALPFCCYDPTLQEGKRRLIGVK